MSEHKYDYVAVEDVVKRVAETLKGLESDYDPRDVSSQPIHQRCSMTRLISLSR